MTQDIRELVDLAALACGYTLKDDYDANGDYWPWCEELEQHWHPLDDGDGARMEAELLIWPEWWDNCVHAGRRGEGPLFPAEKYADHNGNRQTARRMASLRVAAEIGRRMK